VLLVAPLRDAEKESAALGGAREALWRANEDEREKERAAAVESRLRELEADAAALAVGEHGVLLMALLRDEEEESGGPVSRWRGRRSGALRGRRASEAGRRSREMGE
jgi:hypothetical protein